MSDLFHQIVFVAHTIRMNVLFVRFIEFRSYSVNILLTKLSAIQKRNQFKLLFIVIIIIVLSTVQCVAFLSIAFNWDKIIIWIWSVEIISEDNFFSCVNDRNFIGYTEFTRMEFCFLKKTIHMFMHTCKPTHSYSGLFIWLQCKYGIVKFQVTNFQLKKALIQVIDMLCEKSSGCYLILHRFYFFRFSFIDRHSFSLPKWII